MSSVILFDFYLRWVDMEYFFFKDYSVMLDIEISLFSDFILVMFFFDDVKE